MKSFLLINGNCINLSEVAKLDVQNATFTTFEKTVFSLINNWNSTQNNFTLFTSGSTGKPKQITFTKHQLKTSAQLTIDALSLKPFQTSLICLDPSFIAGQMMIIRSLENSMNMVVIEPSADPLRLIAKDEKIDFAAFVPYQLKAILESKDATEKLNQIRTIIIGGAALDDKTKQQLQELDCQIYATYGMTETITHIALQKINGVDKQDYFKALKGITLSVDERNCLTIEASHFNEKIITNDIVELISNDKFRWIGRFDNVINSGGLKIIPENIEEKSKKAFVELNISDRYFIAGIPDSKLGQKAILVIERKDDSIKNELSNRLVGCLSKYEIPKEIYFVTNFIETKTQKIDRKETLKILGL